MKYNIYVIITSISMEGGDSMREVFSFILDVIVQVLGNYLYKLLGSKLNSKCQPKNGPQLLSKSGPDIVKN